MPQKRARTHPRSRQQQIGFSRRRHAVPVAAGPDAPTSEATRCKQLDADATNRDTIRLLQHVNSLKIELGALWRHRQLAP
jgi:hypothetical protein